MTSPSVTRLKITYATLRADNDELHAAFDRGIERARAELGATHPMYVNAQPRPGDATFEDRSPADRDLLVGRFAVGTRHDAREAIAAARAAAAGWRRTPWPERVALLRHAADLISERQMEYAALMSFEVGKNRLEALADVEETADLIRYYCDQMEEHDGFNVPMGNLGDATVHTRSVLKPHGVWAVISPFNFPLALAGGPAGGALVAGNTVVFKPSSDAPLLGVKLYEAFRDAGVPAGVFNLVTGPGRTVGAELQENPGVDGLIFTGSFEVGIDIYRHFAKDFPKPAIVEMGGKNPAIVSRNADLDEAAEGVMRSAFGFGGQKCSACSRVYVERAVHDDFLDLLVEKSQALVVGDPLDRATYVGPVITANAVETYERAVAEARRDGLVVLGGERLHGAGTGAAAGAGAGARVGGGSGKGGANLDRGNFVAPTIVDALPLDHRLFRDELFVPLVAVGTVDSLDEAFARSNDSIYGLTAGFYSEDRTEIAAFLDAVEAGVVYVNRRAGATTGAWPGIQPFGGWKGSGTTGKAGGGLYHLQQFLREQSQTVVDQGW
jgi:1-pyrroline-5-carboxylate dehydrogenase